MTVHSSAIVEDGGRGGDGGEIGRFCVVGQEVVLHEGVRLISHASVTGLTEIGARTVIYPQAAVGGDGQIRENDFREGRILIGADCVIREGVTINVGSRGGRGLTQIGDRGYLMAYSHVRHDCSVDTDVTFAHV